MKKRLAQLKPLDWLFLGSVGGFAGSIAGLIARRWL